MTEPTLTEVRKDLDERIENKNYSLEYLANVLRLTLGWMDEALSGVHSVDQLAISIGQDLDDLQERVENIPDCDVLKDSIGILENDIEDLRREMEAME